jgi:hypothetical protein
MYTKSIIKIKMNVGKVRLWNPLLMLVYFISFHPAKNWNIFTQQTQYCFPFYAMKLYIQPDYVTCFLCYAILFPGYLPGYAGWKYE